MLRRYLVPDVRGFDRTFWVLFAGTFVNRLGTFVLPLFAIYLTEARGLSVEKAGFVAALYGAGSIAAGPIGGFLADRVGRRATLVGALAISAAAMLHLGAARTTGHIAVAALLLGLVSETYRPAVHAAVADVVPAGDRTRAYALLYWAINLGFAIGFALGGWMASRSFTAIFLADAATTIVFAILVWRLVPETRPGQGESRARADWTAPYRDGVFLAFAGLSFVIATVFLQFTVTLPLDMRRHGVSSQAYGTLMAMNGALIVVVQASLTQLIARYRRSHVLAAGALLVGLGYGMNALGGSIPIYAASIAVWTIGEILLLPTAPTVIADLAPPSLRGSYQGVYQLAWGTSNFAAPALGGLVYGRFGAQALWIGCAGVGALAALGHLAIAPARRRRLSAREPEPLSLSA